jgi:hypothetical protein
MHGHRSTLAVLVVLALCFLLSCSESVVDPDASYLEEAGTGGDATLGGPRRDELNLRGTLLVATRGGLFAVNHRGESFLMNAIGSATVDVEVAGTRIFMQTYGDIMEIDHSGAVLSTIPVPDQIGYPIGFAALPDGGFAVFDCEADSVYFLDSTGTLLQAVAMPGEDAPGHLQIMAGLVMGNDLIVSESGRGHIAKFDLTTYAMTVLRDFGHPSSDGFYGDIEHLGRYYYLCRPRLIQRFTETSDLEVVADFTDEYNAVAIALMRNHAYVALNFAGKVYKVNLSSGKTRTLLDGLDRPRDIEFIPAFLEPPAGP